MRVDFSEPESSNCFHCRILNTLESEPSNVIVSSVNSTPVNSKPVQSLEHASAAVGSISASTSAPVQALGHDSAAVGSTSTSSPIQALGHESSSVGSTSTSSPVQALSHDSAAVGSNSTSSPVQALGHDDSAATGSISTFSFGSQTPSAPPVITSVCSEPVQTLTPTSLRSDVFGSPFQATSGSGASATSTSLTSSLFQSSSQNRFLFPPAITSVSSAPTQAFGPNGFGFGAFSDPTHPRLGSMQAPVQATSGFGASVTSTSSTSSSVQSSSPFGFAPVVTSVSSAPTQAFGQTTFGFGSSPNSFGSAPAVTSVSSAPTQAFGPDTCGFSLFAAPTQPRHGSMQVPGQATSGFNLFAAPTQPTLGSMQATFAAQTPSSPVEDTFGSGASGTSTSNSFLPFGSIPAPPTNASSLFRPMLNSPWTTNSLSTGGSVDWGRSDVGVLPATSSSNLFGPNPSDVGVLPATSSSNLFGPNPSTPTEVFGAKPGSVSWPAQDYPRTGINRFALHSSPSNFFGQNIPPTGSYPGFPGYGVDYLPGSNSNPFGSNPYTTGGGSIFGGPKTSSPQPFGFNAATTPRYAPTPDGVTGGMYTSISASMSHQHKSHEELRWEDYKKGNKGSKTNTVFGSLPMASPSIFASPSVPDHPQRTTFGTTQESFTGPFSVFPQHNPAFTGFGTQFPNPSSSFFTTFPPINSSVERPHETASVSSPASGCTACGATTSTSAYGYSTFNGATLTPPSAATTSLPGLFYPMYGSVPMMFGTNPAAQITTQVLQAYPVNGYILLPFAAVKLQ